MKTSTPLTVIVNKGGGAASAAGAELENMLESAFAASGAKAVIKLCDGDEMAAQIRRTEKHGRVVVAGGDGTAACAAEALKGSDREMGLLPLGTLNHLAKDLGIPADLAAAADVAANGLVTAIDVGTVNGHRFVNNASIGIYPAMVREREELREANGWPKWFASIPAAWTALSRLPHHRLRIDMGQGQNPLVTPLLFVGNNMYSIERGAIGTRESLQDGRMSVFAVARKSRLALIWFALRGVAGKANRQEDFVALGECTELKVWSRSTSIELALDGEILRLETPLHFKSEAGALKILIPHPEATTTQPDQ